MTKPKIRAYFNTKEDKLLLPEEFRKMRVGVYGICVKDEKVLTIKNVPKTKNRFGKIALEKPLWDIPGGKIEHGETMTEALWREFYEETGVKIKNAKLWYVNQAFYCCFEVPNTNVQIYYLVELECENFTVNNKDSSEVKWNSLNDLSRKNSMPGLYQIVDKIKKELL